MDIPKKFCTDGNPVIVRTVGQLKAALSELPDNLPVKCEFAEAAQVVVYNVGHDPHMELEEPNESEF